MQASYFVLRFHDHKDSENMFAILSRANGAHCATPYSGYIAGGFPNLSRQVVFSTWFVWRGLEEEDGHRERERERAALA